MELKKLNINGKEIEFANVSRGARNGFAHDTTVFIDGMRYGTHTCHYLNRTWERYTYQSVMRCAICDLRDEREEYLKREFKRVNGYTKLTAKRAEQFAEQIKGDEYIALYNAILAEL